MVREVTSTTFESEVLGATQPVLVDFWAAWCGPCRMMAPIVEELAGGYAGKVQFLKLNVDDHQDIAMRYGIQSIPTFLVFKSGRPVARLVGAVPKRELKTHIDALLVSIAP